MNGAARIGLVIARRFSRTRRLRASAVIAAVVAALITMMYMVFQALTLTAQQEADRDLGRYDAAVVIPATIEPGVDARGPILDAVEQASGGRSDVVLVTQSLSVPEISGDPVGYAEMDWASRPRPDALELRSGRWPSRPGEVVISNPEPGRAVPDEVSVFGGRAQWTVVGTVEKYFTDHLEVLAGPGTWAEMDSALGESHSGLSAQPTLYWNGSEPDAVVDAVATAVRSLPGDDVELPERHVLVSALRDGYVDRASVLADGGAKPWIAKSPAGYAIPSLLLPLVAALVIFSVNLRRLAVSMRAITALGASRRVAVSGAALSVAGWCLVASVVGTAFGYGAGFGVGRWLASWQALPRPALPSPLDPVARIVSMTLVGCLVGTLVLAGAIRGTDRESRRRHEQSSWLPQARRAIAAFVLMVAGAIQLPTLSTPQDAMMLTGTLTFAVLLLLPDIVPWLLRHLPERGPAWRLSRRQMLADHRNATVFVGVLTVLVTLSTGFVAQISTMIATESDQTYAEVLPGQALITDRASGGMHPATDAEIKVATSTATLAEQEPVQLRFVDKPGGDDVMLGGQCCVLVVDTADHAKRLVGSSYTAQHTEVLRTGGMLVTQESVSDTIALRSESTGDMLTQLPSRAVTFPAQAHWQDRVAGVILATTARQHDLPVAEGGLLYTGIGHDDAAAVRDALESAGMDPRVALVYEEPPPAIPPLGLTLTAVGLVVITLVASLWLTRTQVRAQRDRLGQLIRLGVSTGWAAGILRRQHTTVVGLATVLGLALGLTAALTSAWALSGFVLHIPWEQLAVLLAALYVSALSVTLLARRRLTARSGQTE